MSGVHHPPRPPPHVPAASVETDTDDDDDEHDLPPRPTATRIAPAPPRRLPTAATSAAPASAPPARRKPPPARPRKEGTATPAKRRSKKQTPSPMSGRPVTLAARADTPRSQPPPASAAPAARGVRLRATPPRTKLEAANAAIAVNTAAARRARPATMLEAASAVVPGMFRRAPGPPPAPAAPKKSARVPRVPPPPPPPPPPQRRHAGAVKKMFLQQWNAAATLRQPAHVASSPNAASARPAPAARVAAGANGRRAPAALSGVGAASAKPTIQKTKTKRKYKPRAKAAAAQQRHSVPPRHIAAPAQPPASAGAGSRAPPGAVFASNVPHKISAGNAVPRLTGRRLPQFSAQAHASVSGAQAPVASSAHTGNFALYQQARPVGQTPIAPARYPGSAYELLHPPQPAHAGGPHRPSFEAPPGGAQLGSGNRSQPAIRRRFVAQPAPGERRHSAGSVVELGKRAVDARAAANGAATGEVAAGAKAGTGPPYPKRRRYPKLLAYDPSGMPLSVRMADQKGSLMVRERVMTSNRPPQKETIIEAGGRAGNVQYWRNSLQMPRTVKAVKVGRKRAAPPSPAAALATAAKAPTPPSPVCTPVTPQQPPPSAPGENDVGEQDQNMYWRQVSKLPSAGAEDQGRHVSVNVRVLTRPDAPGAEAGPAAGAAAGATVAVAAGAVESEEGSDLRAVAASAEERWKSLPADLSWVPEEEQEQEASNETRVQEVIAVEMTRIQTLASAKYHVKMNLRGRSKLEAWLNGKDPDIRSAVRFLARKMDMDAKIMSGEQSVRKVALYEMRNTHLRCIEALYTRMSSSREGSNNWAYICDSMRQPAAAAAAAAAAARDAQPPQQPQPQPPRTEMEMDVEVETEVPERNNGKDDLASDAAAPARTQQGDEGNGDAGAGDAARARAPAAA